MKPLRNVLALSLLILAATAAGRAESSDPISINDVIWTNPGKNSSDCMLLGNGDLGIHLWVQENGELWFYPGRNDALSEVSQRCKAGMVCVSLAPNPFVAGAPFRQYLKLRDGVCEITAGISDKEVILEVFVDSASPVVHLVVNSDQPLSVAAKVESWRTNPQPLPDKASWTLGKGPLKPIQSAAVFPKAEKSEVLPKERSENVVFPVAIEAP